MKHAYLIIAHNEPQLLQNLIDLIDDKRNDIYIHIDKKSDIKQFSDISASESRLYFIPRKSVYWGHYSQVQTELRLMAFAKNNASYSYYHLLSGVDLPLHNQDYIHNYFERHNGTEFVEVLEFTEEIRKDIFYKNYRWFFFQRFLRSGNPLLEKIFHISELIQFKMPILRRHNIEIYKGSNWFSITEAFVNYILSNKRLIFDEFRWSNCADELFLQSLFAKSIFYKNKSNKAQGNLRAIDWRRGHPYIWRNTDFDELVSSEALFARKFSLKTDKEIVLKIYDYITGG